MKKLTNKNYKQLPEMQKKKLEEKKKEELRQRRENQKKFDQVKKKMTQKIKFFLSRIGENHAGPKIQLNDSNPYSQP